MTQKKSFLFVIDAVFQITGRGTIVTGRIENGSIKTGQKVKIIDHNKKELKSECIELEMFRRHIKEAHKGDYIGIALSNVNKYELSKDMLIIEDN